MIFTKVGVFFLMKYLWKEYWKIKPITNNAGKAPQWYNVKEGDATMFIHGSAARTKKEKAAP